MKRTCVRSPDRFQNTNIASRGEIARAEAPQGPGQGTSALATVPIALVGGLAIRIA
jgi:hypothetical protein